MTPRARRIVPLILVLCLAGLASGCGHKEKVVLHAKTEGTFLNVGPLDYQVQISRALNPKDPEDRTFLEGLPRDQRTLAPGETWFAIFIRVENNGKKPAPSAQDFSIVDTEKQLYKPTTLASINPFAYRPQNVPPADVLPQLETAAANNQIQGELILFKIKVFSLQNRPLEFRITSPQVPQVEGTVDLDV